MQVGLSVTMPKKLKRTHVEFAILLGLYEGVWFLIGLGLTPYYGALGSFLLIVIVNALTYLVVSRERRR